MNTETVTVNGARVDYGAGDLLPEHIRPGMQRYIERRVEPGSFLLAVLEGDLFDAVGRADAINRPAIPDICVWLYNHAPTGCWGSAEKVRDWLGYAQAEADRRSDAA